jgi:uncharacterized protein YabN with tetrapyrrole methylase and pyrophosphatase domain
MQIKPFRIEQYFGKYEFTAKYLLSCSDAESRTIKELLDLEPGAYERLLEHWCGYTESPGAPELREAIADKQQDDIEDEVGDLFFVLVNIARTLKVDSESALKRANRKFKARFQHMEAELAASGKSLDETALEEMENLWKHAKRETDPQ